MEISTFTFIHYIVFVAACHRSVPLGMMSGDIQDWQISASSTTPTEWDRGCHERFARLYHGKARSWCAKYKSPSEWLQIDLGVASKVGIASASRFCCSSATSYYYDKFFGYILENARDLHCVSKTTTIHLTFYHNFGKCRPIFKILSLPDS